MGIKIVVDSSGLYQVPTSGTSTEFQMADVQITSSPKSPPDVYLSGSVGTASSNGFIIFEPIASNSVFNLPPITTSNIGKQYTIMTNYIFPIGMTLSGTNPIGPNGASASGAWTKLVANISGSATVMAVSASGGFHWHVISIT